MCRSLLFAAIIILLGAAFRPVISPKTGDVTGTWKRTSMTLVEASGKTDDLMQMMTKSMPCTKDVTYTFSSNGRLTSKVPDACGKLKKTVESMNTGAKWSISGRKLTVTTTMKEFPITIYDVSFQGNTMTWEFIYADNPKTANPTKAKKITTTYQRV